MTDYKQLQRLAYSLCLTVFCIAVYAFHKQGAVCTRNVLVFCTELKDTSVASGGFKFCTCGYRAAWLVNHKVVYLGRVNLDFLCFEHEVHKRGVVRIKLKKFLVDVHLYKVTAINTACCFGCTRYGCRCATNLGLQTCRASTYVYGACCYAYFFHSFKNLMF